MPKGHNDPTVNEPEIMVLLRQVLDLCGKGKSYAAKGISISFDIFLQFPMLTMFENDFQTWCSNFTMIQRLVSPRLSFYYDRFECMRKKERVLGGGEGKTKLRRRESTETIVSLKIDLTCLYL